MHAKFVQVVITQGAVVLPEKIAAPFGQERVCIASCNRLLLGVPGATLDFVNTGVTIDAGVLLIPCCRLSACGRQAKLLMMQLSLIHI